MYHGTATKFEKSIDESGLISKSRLYVHLSTGIETAIQVGARHGEVLIYVVDCQKMIQDGYTFFQSKNGVWLIRSVPKKYLKKLGNHI